MNNTAVNMDFNNCITSVYRLVVVRLVSERIDIKQK